MNAQAAEGLHRMVDRHRRLGELSGEFVGTLVMVLFGLGAEVAVLTGDGHFGDWGVITLGWGLGVTCAVYVSARLSGPHLNPALTIALAVCRKFPWRKVLPYAAAQLAGAFVAGLIVRVGYGELLFRFDPDTSMKSQVAFSTLPGNGVVEVGLATAFFAEVTATALLVLVLCALLTPANNPPLANLTPMLIGWLVVAVGMSWGANSGYAVNPARDFGPRLVSLLTGYETALYDQYGNLYFWLPIVAPILGGALGAWLFTVCVEQFLPTADLSVAPLSQYVPKVENQTLAVPVSGRLATRAQVPDAPLFVYGSLQFADVLRVLLDRVPDHSPAEAYGWRAAALPGVEYPGLVPANPMSTVTGAVLTGIQPDEWELLDAFEDPVYHLTLLTLRDGRRAWSFTCAESTSIMDFNWSVGSFADHYLAGYLQRCAVWHQQYLLSEGLAGLREKPAPDPAADRRRPERTPAHAVNGAVAPPRPVPEPTARTVLSPHP